MKFAPISCGRRGAANSGKPDARGASRLFGPANP